MTQEQKAKAYDEALKRAKKILCNINEYSDSCRDIETIFPELKESEDERIRKWLLDTIRQIPNDSIEWEVIEKEKVIAYLEKQKDAFSGPLDWNDAKDKPVEIWNSYIRGKVYGMELGKEAVKNNPKDYGLERQKEQKPILKFKVGDKVHLEGDDVNILTITGIENDRYLTDCAYGPILFGSEDIWQIVEQKPAVKQLGGTFNSYDMAKTFAEGQYYVMEHPERFGLCKKPAEWSEEDKDFINMLILHFNYMIDKEMKEDGASVETYKSYREKLKSLRPQPHTVSIKNANKFAKLEYERGVKDGLNYRWKPSEPEKGALATAIYVLREENFPKAAEHLQDILNAFEQKSDYKVGDKISWKGKVYTIDKVVCYDNLFGIIGRAKQDLVDKTDIADSPEEMAVLDNFLFRCWQMGWLKKYEDNANEDNT